jgi:hypothetical protein
MFHEQRIDPREHLVLLLKLGDGRQARTRDISAGGLFFEMEGDYGMGELVDFELQLLDVHMKFTATGEIVRLEYRDGKTGVAVKLIEPRLELMG